MMAKSDSIPALLARARRLPYLVVVLALLVLAGALFFTTRLLRDQIRAQVASRDGEVLAALAAMHMEAVREDLAGLAEFGLEEFSSLEAPENQIMVLLRTSRLNQVIGARLFDAQGGFEETFPPHVLAASLAAADLAQLERLMPVSHFRPAVPLGDLFYPDPEDPPDPNQKLPILEVNVPLYTLKQPRLLGIAQFLIQGESLAAELRRLDWNLFLLGSAAFLVAGTLLGGTLALAFRRLRRAQDLLAERTRHLLQANQELTLAAKSSAVGAVTAHLLHALKNPLSGLQSFVASLGSTPSPGHMEEAWQQAVASTRRMQTLIHQVVQVLREQEGTHQYQISLEELAEVVAAKTQGATESAQVKLVTRLECAGTLTSRAANLVILILVNLVENAVEVSPAGGEVTLRVCRPGEELVWEVRDQGPGFPATLRSSLFSPCPTTKEGGSGIGLAIAKLLANHLQARLELMESSPDGCVFALGLPVRLLQA